MHDFLNGKVIQTVNREDICVQTLLLLFKCANHRNKRPFVSTASEAVVGSLMKIGEVNDIFPIRIIQLNSAM